jgi:two-component system, cell cycle response regulator
MLLVVDDDEVNRDILARRLKRDGHHVGTAADGAQALDMAAAERFDVVLLDIMMPVLDGYQVLERMKSDARLRDIPVIVLSASSELESVVRCIELGAEDYLPKPFDPVLLRARIGACLEKKRLRDRELLYLRDVASITAAAAAVEAGTFRPEDLTEVGRRTDELGQLARVFQRMAREIQGREERLKQQVQELRIEIDEARKARQVAEITETEYFQQLRKKAKELREKAETSDM